MSYLSMKLGDLKTELKKRGLPITGKKDVLIKRLQDEDAKEKKEEKTSDNAEETITTSDTKEEKEKEEKEGKEEKEKEEKEEKEKKQEAPEQEGKKKGKRKLEEAASEEILDHLTDPGWKEALSEEFKKPYFREILTFLGGELSSGKEIFPPQNEIFAALNYTPIDKVRVVILGQDPYHDNNQANGLCFSVRDGINHPPSLKNIFKELVTDIPGFKTPKSGSLEKWAHRGVLLLNATLTVQAHTANSHSKIGWLQFTDAIIDVLNKKTKGVVFILWGGFAQKKGKIIDKSKHFIIEAAHPSPLSAGKFFGCKVFSKTNAILEREGYETIDWTL